MGIYEKTTDLIGKTPLIRTSFNRNVFAKLENLNPAGSAKDRVALNMIEEAEERGELKKGNLIIEATSGNTGIGLAMVSAVKGYKCIIIMPDTMSKERQNLIRAYGAEVILTDGKLGMKGSIEKAEEIKKENPGAVIMGQFVNEDNAMAHYKTTGKEIWEDLDGKVDIFIATVGTGGTLTGTGRYLKEKNPDIKIFAVEPSRSPYLSEGKAGKHKIEGIGAGFAPDVLDKSIYDEVITVSDEDAFKESREFAKREAILVGISSGAAIKAAKEIAKREENKDKNIVFVVPDSGDRYLSTDLSK